MKLAFIGYGNMANALINGILASDKNILSDDLYIFHNKENSQYKLDRCKFKKSGEIYQSKFDIVFLCTKPVDIKSSINENIKIFSDGQIIVSIAAGISISTIKKIIDKQINISKDLLKENITSELMHLDLLKEKQYLITQISDTTKNIEAIKLPAKTTKTFNS